MNDGSHCPRVDYWDNLKLVFWSHLWLVKPNACEQVQLQFNTLLLSLMMFCTDYFYNNFRVYIYKNIVKLEYQVYIRILLTMSPVINILFYYIIVVPLL